MSGDGFIQYIDPANKEGLCGLPHRKLINLAKRKGWPTTRLYGRIHIGKKAFFHWLEEQPFIERDGRKFTNINNGTYWIIATEDY